MVEYHNVASTRSLIARTKPSARTDERLDAVLAALADRTRRAIVAELVRHESRVTEVAAPFAMSLNAVSKHIRVLEHAGVLKRRIEGRNHYLSVDLEALATVEQWIEHTRSFWNARLDSLELALEQRRGS